MTENEQTDESPDVQALNAIATQIAGFRKEHRKPKPLIGSSAADLFQTFTGIDPAEARERERQRREEEQAKLYRLVVLIAAVSAIASVASVVVAALH